jgi:very-short-patch-repair endonuclease
MKCPDGRGKLLCLDKECPVCIDRRLLPIVREHWIDEKNIGVNPDTDVTRGSNKKYWFRCLKGCGHEAELVVCVQPRKCKYCSGHGPCCSNPECVTCEERRLSKYIRDECFIQEDNEGIDILTISRKSNKSLWLLCKRPECRHPMLLAVGEYTVNIGCKYCTGTDLCDDYNCDVCVNNRFSSHPMSIYWKSSNTIDTEDLRMHSHTRGMFLCPYCNNDYEASLHDVSSGYWCGCRGNITEGNVLEWVRETYPQYKIIPQMVFPSLPRKRYDITIDDVTIIIEVDGRQHYEQVPAWDPVEEVQRRDIEKIVEAINQGYTIIHISQIDIRNNYIDWRRLLTRTIRLYDYPIAIFISKDDVYDRVHIPRIKEKGIPVLII